MPTLSDHLRAFLQRPPNQVQVSLWAFLRGRDPWVLAHHPPTKVFESHVWKMGGFYICKGCLMAWMGAGLGLLAHPVLLLVFGNWWRQVPVWQVVVGFGLLLIPSVLTAFWKQVPVFKHAARLLLGLLVVSAGVYFLALPWNTWAAWGVRVLLLAVYLAVRLPLERKRLRENAGLVKKQ